MKYTTAVLILLSLTFRGALCMESDEQEETLRYSSTPLVKVKNRSGYGSVNRDVEAQRNDDKLVCGCWRKEQTGTVMAVCIPFCAVMGVFTWIMVAPPFGGSSEVEDPILPSFSNYSLSAKNHME
jgi:hypothetical protein